jgi:DNA-binding NarL/FixJ family response regulator
MEPMSIDSLDVLIAEDHPLWREFIRSTLQQYSEAWNLHDVTDGPEAIQQARDLQPGLVVLDMGLPTLSGIETARQIREVSSHSKILFFSQELSPSLVLEALSVGDGYVAKIDAGRELVSAVTTILRGGRFVGDRFTEHDSEYQQGPGGKHGHVVYFYPDDDQLLNRLTELFRQTVRRGESIIAVTTREHRLGLLGRLIAQRIDVSNAIATGQVTFCDAFEELDRFMDGDDPNDARFLFQFGDMMRKAAAASAAGAKRVVVFGEMVALLWAQKKYGAAIHLEQLWNELTRTYAFYLCCAYPAHEFAENSGGHRAAICAEHTCEVSAF